MASITAELALEVSKFQGALRQAQNSLRSFRTQARSQGAGLGSAIFASVGKAAAGIGAILAGAKIASKTGELISGSIQRAVDAEQLQVSFDVLIGDASKATNTIESLRKLGADTPLEFPELAEAARQLIAFQEDASTVTDTLRRIGDVSTGIQAPIGEIAEMYGRARVQGRLFSQDLKRLTSRGIPIIQEFAKQLGVTDSEVQKMASAGKLSFSNLEQAFIDLTSEGGKFNNMMERQSHTVGGLWSTLQDNFGEMLLSFGEPINDALRPLLEDAVEQVDKLQEGAARLGAALSSAMRIVIGIFREFSMGEIGLLLLDSLVLAFKSSVNTLYRGLVSVIAAAGRFIVEIFKSALTLFSILGTADFWKGMGNVLAGVAKTFAAILMELLAKAIEQIKRIPGASRLLGDSDSSLRNTAESLRKGADEKLARGSDLLTPAFEAVQQQMGETFQNVGEVFTDVWNNLDDLMDTDGEESRLADAVLRMMDRMAQMDKKPEVSKGGGPPPALASAGKMETGRLATGAFASAINLIMGRSANEMILDETKKQTEMQQRMVSELQGLNQKMTPTPQSSAPAAPVLAVDTVARFG